MHEITGQVHWHEPSGFKRAGFGKFSRPKTPYDLFMEADDIPVYRDIGVSKVQNLPLQPWKRMGGRGSYIQLHGTEGKWGAYVVEVPGAGAELALTMRCMALTGIENSEPFCHSNTWRLLSPSSQTSVEPRPSTTR